MFVLGRGYFNFDLNKFTYNAWIVKFILRVVKIKYSYFTKYAAHYLTAINTVIMLADIIQLLLKFITALKYCILKIVF